VNLKKIGLSLVKFVANKQNSLTAKHTAYYLAVESFIYGSLLTVFVSFTGLITTLELVSTYGSFLLFSLSTYIVLISRKESDSPAVAEFNLSSVATILLLSLIPSLFGYGVRQSIAPISITLVSLLLYVLILQYRNRRYLGVSEFFVNKYSESQSDWIEASVALEKAMMHMEDNRFRSYYWALRAEHSYRSAAKIDRLYLRDIAMEFATVSSMISSAMISEKHHKHMYISEAYLTLSRAIEKSREQLCDNCGRQMHTGNIFETDSDGDKVEYCTHCRISSSNNTVTQSRENRGRRAEQKSRHSKTNVGEGSGVDRGYPGAGKNDKSTEERKRTERKQKWEEWQRTAHRNTRGNYSKGSKKEQKREDKDEKQSSENEELTIEESLKILDLSENVDDVSAVTDAFRERVKDVHPDVGGDDAEFKKAKRAREEIIRNIKGN
jgi:hypothetical protein